MLLLLEVNLSPLASYFCCGIWHLLFEAYQDPTSPSLTVVKTPSIAKGACTADCSLDCPCCEATPLQGSSPAGLYGVRLFFGLPSLPRLHRLAGEVCFATSKREAASSSSRRVRSGLSAPAAARSNRTASLMCFGAFVEGMTLHARLAGGGPSTKSNIVSPQYRSPTVGFSCCGCCLAGWTVTSPICNNGIPDRTVKSGHAGLHQRRARQPPRRKWR